MKLTFINLLWFLIQQPVANRLFHVVPKTMVCSYSNLAETSEDRSLQPRSPPHLTSIFLRSLTDPCPDLRTLDAELRAHVKGNDPGFDLSKLAFFAEATGMVQESHIADGQSAVANARKTSLQAGFALFRTSLSNDQVLHERFLAASKTDEARVRVAALASLEVSSFFFGLALFVLLSVLSKLTRVTLTENAHNCMGLGAELCQRQCAHLECWPEEVPRRGKPSYCNWSRFGLAV